MNLLIRMSTERGWSSEPFTAAAPDDLRHGCLEAFVALRTEWTARCAVEIPAYQTIRRQRHESKRPRSLYVQVCYRNEWSVAPPITPVVHEPGSVPDAGCAWVDADWPGAWARCVRTFEHVEALCRLANWAAKP